MAKRWVQNVKTVSTFPPKDTFNRPAKEVARIMADPKVSPKGLGSAIRMVQYFINRAGKGLSEKQRNELEKAKRLLQRQNAEAKDAQPQPRTRKSSTHRATSSRSRPQRNRIRKSWQ